LVLNRGNASLKPQINHNLSFGVTAFDYFFLNAYHSIIPAQNVSLYQTESGYMVLSQQTLEGTSRSGINLGLPFPYILLTKSLGEILRSRVQLDINKLSFSYINLGWNRYDLGSGLPFEFDKNAYYLNVFTQIYLKNELRLYMSYNVFFKGGWNSYTLNKNAQNLDVYLKKKFLKNNRLSLTLGVYNALDNAGYDINAYGRDVSMNINNTHEKRSYVLGLSFSFGSFRENSNVIPDRDADIAPIDR